MIRLVFAMFVVGFPFVGCAWAAPADVLINQDPRTMEFPPIEFHPPEAERIALSNGLVVYLLEDHELPIIKVSAMIRTGRIYEPPDKVGLAALTGTVMRTGGVGSLAGDELDEELEFVGAVMQSGIGLDAGSASLNLLSKDAPRGIALFAKMLMHPGFSPEKVDLAKKQAIEGIRRRNDHPGSIVAREFNKLLYGPRHPYGRESTMETLNDITRKDLVEFHARYYHPNTTMLAVTGDFDRDALLALITKGFEAWRPQKVSWPEIPTVVDSTGPTINYIERDVTQTRVRMGHLGITQANPDYFAFALLNNILGGQAFTSRLFQEIRTKTGLAYSVGSVLRSGKFERGVFFLYAQTKAETTAQGISAMFEQLREIRSRPVTPQELKQAKQSFLNSFVFAFSTPSQVVGRQMSLEYYGLPSDFLEQFRDNVARVTTDELHKVAQRYLKPDRTILLAVGKQSAFDEPLSTFGSVNEIVLEHVGESSASPAHNMESVQP